jgi:hypothetical protein
MSNEHNIYTILESLDRAQRSVKQLPAQFEPGSASPALDGDYNTKNVTRGYLVGESGSYDASMDPEYRRPQPRAVDPDDREQAPITRGSSAPRELSPEQQAEFDKYMRHLERRSVREGASEFGIGDPVIITGDVEFRGKTGDVREFDRDGSFVVVDLYNHGAYSFHTSDVSYNDYADEEDDEEDVAEGYDTEELANEVYAEFERTYPNLARRANERTVHAAIMDVLNYGGDSDPAALAQDVARAVKKDTQGVAEEKAGWSIKTDKPSQPTKKGPAPSWRLNPDGTTTDMNSGVTYNRDGSKKPGVAEGLGKTIKRSVAGWGAFNKEKPKDVVNKVKGQDTDVLKRLSDPAAKKGKGSPAELQQKAISRELKKRGEPGAAAALKESTTTEDVVSTVKRKLGDYLQDVATAIKQDPDLIKKVPTDIDQIKAVKTLVTDDGHEIKIHGNEDDGFRVSIKNRNAKSRFKSLDEAAIAAEMYCARRRDRLANQDYLEEQ